MTQQQEPSEEFFDAATAPQASQDVARWRQDPSYYPPFEIVRWRVVDEEWKGRRAIDAVVVAEVNGQEDIEAAQGVGGVQALDSALRRVLLHHFSGYQRHTARRAVHPSGWARDRRRGGVDYEI